MKLFDRIFGQIKQQTVAPDAPASTVQTETTFLQSVARETERDLQRPTQHAPAQAEIDPSAERRALKREEDRDVAQAARDYRARQIETARANKAQQRQERASILQLIRSGYKPREGEFDGVEYEQHDPEQV